jgi:ligand-binding sensor domain-containing protein/signal transduction histidine kinase
LIRFDGFNFRTFDKTNSQELLPRAVQGLTTDAEGNLWIQQQDTTLLRYRGARFQEILRDLVHSSNGVTSMCRGSDGEILFPAQSRGILAYGRGGIRTVAVQAGLPFFIISMAETPDGQVWLGTRDAGLFSLSGGRVASFAQGLPDRKVNSLLAVETRDLWIGTDSGAVRWNGVALTTDGIPRALEHTKILAMIKDRRSNIWVSTANGLLRIDSKGPAVWEQRWRTPGDAVTALFEDREGNVWVGTKEGLESFRESPFLAYPLPTGSGSENNGPLYVDDEGRTWSAAPDGGLVWRRRTELQRITKADFNGDVVYSIAGRNGDVWIGRRKGGLTHLHYRGGALEAETYTQTQGLSRNSVYAVHLSSDGSVWAGTLTGGVSRFHNGRFTTYTAANGLISNTITSIAESPNGTMWFGTPDGLSELSTSRWRNYAGRDKLPPNGVNCLLVGSNDVLWIGTGTGLASLRGRQIESYRGVAGVLGDGILGLAEDRNGWLWVATTEHILRVKRQKLLQGALDDGDLAVYGLTDGLLGDEGVKRQQSVARDSEGRVWFSTNRGICVVDPTRLIGDSLHVLVHIQSISADGSPLPVDGPAKVPPGRRRIIFGYVGLSLSFPQGVRFRYKLDRFDKDWTGPVSDREAVYTNLSPGSYRFRVVASNADGVWSSTEATVGLQVEPAFWQTWWFAACLALACLLAIAAIYRFRLSQISVQLKHRFDERLSERTRIAQELHDTLLQGFLSASMQVHVAAGRLPSNSPAMPPLSRAIELMEQASREGRIALRGLRSTQSDLLNLEQAFSRIPEELNVSADIRFRITVEGKQQPLQPLLRDDVYRIGREALVNAFCHSRATNIEIEMHYGSNEFRFLVRDDGCGIDPQTLQSGRAGHWGIMGMRERAEAIGAKFSVRSSTTAGTEVILYVPSAGAFRVVGANGSRRWVRALFSRKVGK